MKTGAPPPNVPAEEGQSGSLPLEARDGASTVAVPGSWERAALVSRPLPGTIVRLAGPAVASMLLMTVFGTIDAFWVGRSIGPMALAAVTTSVFWVWMTVAIAEMIGVGLTAVAARRHGELRHGESARVAGEAIIYAFVLGSIVGIGMISVIDQLFALMQTPPEITELGRSYLRTYLFGAPLIFGFFAVDATFRASGDTRTPLTLLAASVAVTLVLDPVLILGLGPAPQLGVAGAAIATVTTRGAVCMLGLHVLHKRRMVSFGVPRIATLLLISRIGAPLAATGVAFSLIYVALTRIAAPFGTEALAAIGIGHRIESWLYMASVGFGAASAAIVGQNLGAGQVERAARTGWLTVAYATALGAALSVLALLRAEELAGIFTTDPDVIMESARYLRIAAVANLFIGAEIVLEASMGGAGDTIPPMLTSTSITAARIPIAIWAAAEWGTTGIWWTLSLTAAARGIAMLFLWRSGRWKGRIV